MLNEAVLQQKSCFQAVETFNIHQSSNRLSHEMAFFGFFPDGWRFGFCPTSTLKWRDAV
jgi:hypothetical protein